MGFRQRDEETKENVGKSGRRNDGKVAGGCEKKGEREGRLRFRYRLNSETLLSLAKDPYAARR